jgi:hypothetical protein
MHKRILLVLSLIFFTIGTDNALANENLQKIKAENFRGDNLIISDDPDPNLEPGFPVQAIHLGGLCYCRHGIQAVVGNIDNEPTLEIIATGTADGPLYAWNSNGTPVVGWPLTYYDDGYPVMGNLAGDSLRLEIFAAYLDGMLTALNGSGIPLSGWPRASANSMCPPAMADIDGDGVDEIFLGEEDWALHAYKADGNPLPGWPVTEGIGAQIRNTPAIGDIDGDGDFEIITAGQGYTPGVYLFAYHHDGSSVAGFPILFENYGYSYTVPVIGDVDGDSALEIIIIEREPQSPWRPFVHIISSSGIIERSMIATSDIDWGAPLALADLDGDTFPEIIVQSNTAIDVWKGNGSALSGWPVHWGVNLGWSAPVVGDVDGDKWPDIVITTKTVAAQFGTLSVFNRHGQQIFSRAFLPIGWGGVPAIADIDLDRHNEIIVVGNYWDGTEGYFDKVWVYDLGGERHGNIHWGQYGNGANHQGLYIPKTPPPPPIKFYLPIIVR